MIERMGRIGDSMSDEKQLGINIRDLRKLRLLTQDELAERAGFSLQHVGDIERGQANPTLSCLLKLAEVLNVAVSDFFAPAERDTPSGSEIRERLLEFISKAGKKHLAIFYTLYKGMR